MLRVNLDLSSEVQTVPSNLCCLLFVLLAELLLTRVDSGALLAPVERRGGINKNECECVEGIPKNGSCNETLPGKPPWFGLSEGVIVGALAGEAKGDDTVEGEGDGDGDVNGESAGSSPAATAAANKVGENVDEEAKSVL